MPNLPQETWNPIQLGGEVLDAALKLASEGVRVFPIWGVKRVTVPTPAVDGAPPEVRLEYRCACGNAACPNPGKHPVGRLVPNGHNGATTDAGKIAEWLKVPPRWQHDVVAEFGKRGVAIGWIPYNLGVATGRGLVVIDAESRSSRPDLPTGLEVLDDWETWTGGTSLPHDPRVIRSGSGGHHLWLRVDPELHVKSRNRILPGVDVKADGGYVLAPPSMHTSGQRYQVKHDRPWGDVSGELRAWLLTVKGGRYVSRRAGDSASSAVPDDYDFRRIIGSADGCPAGHRDYFVNDLCFRLRRSGASLEDAAAAVRREWLRMERTGDDDFTWDNCLYKLRRVWDEVRPEEVYDLPAWRPAPSSGLAVPAAREVSDEAGGPELAGEDGVGVGVGIAGATATELLNRPELTQNTSDSGNGIRFAQRMREVVRYCVGESKWYIWDGSRWAQDVLNRTMHLTVEIVKDLYVEAADLANETERENVERWAKQSQAIGKRKAMMELAAVQPGIAIEPDQLDADPWILTVRNGTLDLRTGTLRESRPEDLNTRRAEVDFDPGAECPLWMNHIDFVTHRDKLLGDYLRRAVGYTLTGLTGEQKLFFLWGTGQNGKSTFVDVIANLLGSYSTTADENLLTGSGGHPTQLADLRGARLVVADETDRDKKLAEQRIKMMTGRTIKARFMRQDFFRYTPRFKLWVSGNHKPEIRGNDDGIWRRLKLVPFTAKFTEDQRILDYDEVLRGELPGILNWALTGLGDWIKLGGLGETEAVRAATAVYRGEEDVIGQWIVESLDLGVVGEETSAGRIYESYRWWCHANGIQDVKSNIVLGRELAQRGFKSQPPKRVHGVMTRTWVGIRIRSDPVG